LRSSPRVGPSRHHGSTRAPPSGSSAGRSSSTACHTRSTRASRSCGSWWISCSLAPSGHTSAGSGPPPRALRPAPCAPRPISCILSPVPYTLHSEPYTLYPTQCTSNPAPYTLHPPSYTPKPWTSGRLTALGVGRPVGRSTRAHTHPHTHITRARRWLGPCHPGDTTRTRRTCTLCVGLVVVGQSVPPCAQVSNSVPPCVHMSNSVPPCAYMSNSVPPCAHMSNSVPPCAHMSNVPGTHMLSLS
jgi:hypothetical protein